MDRDRGWGRRRRPATVRASLPREEPVASEPVATVKWRGESEYSLVGVAGSGQRCKQFRNVLGTSGFHGDVDGGITKIHAVVGAVVRGLNDVSAMLGEDSGEPVQRTGI